MRKINRRDYLLQMGVGAAGIIAASELPSLGQTGKEPNQGRTKTVPKCDETRPLKWQTTPHKPTLDEFVTVFYCGLIGMAYNDTGQFVDVLFNPGKKHELKIQIYKNPQFPTCTPEPPIPAMGPDDRLVLNVAGQPPKVFQADSLPFDRHTTDDKYKYDFRWMPDFHALYSKEHKLKPKRGTRLKVPTGTFYTRVRTNSTFKMVKRSNCKDVLCDYGRIALYMATAIDAQSDVVLKKENGPDLYTFKTGNKYHLVFQNEDKSFTPKPKDCKENLRNDFHFHRGIIDLPWLERKYSLMPNDSCSECAKPDFCIETHGRGPRLTDEAPCSAAGYGKAGGFLP